MLTLIQFNPDDHQKPRTYRLAGDRAHLIGRRHGDVPLADSRVSRKHAEVSVQNGTWVIRDLNSSNGTWVNGERIAGLCELEDGDRLVIGRLTLIVGHVETEAALATPTAAPPASAAGTLSAAAKASDLAERDPVAVSPVDQEPDLTADDGSSLALELDFDAALDDEMEVDLDLDLAEAGEQEHAAAESPTDSGGVIEMNGPEALRPAEPEPEPDLESAVTPTLVDLDGPDEINVDQDEPGGEASSMIQEVAGEGGGVDEDEHGHEDEYAATVDFVTPTTRPDSPLDANAQDDDASDEAPAVVGLSLDLPAPELEDEANDAAEVGELGDVGELDEVDEIDGVHNADAPAEFSDTEARAEAGAAYAETQAETQADDTGLDYELPADSGVGVELENDAEVAGPAQASTLESASAEADNRSQREPDWVESEEQQELDDAWSSRGASRKKGAAVLVLMALAVAGGFWAINYTSTTTPITGENAASPTPTAPGTDRTPLANADVQTPTAPQPTRTPAVPSRVAPSSPAAAAPMVSASEPSPDENAPDLSARAAPAADAFGQAPTLQAPASAPVPTVRPSQRPAAAGTATASPAAQAPASVSASAAPATSAGSAAAPDRAITPSPVAVERNDENAAGPTLAMIDPLPTLDSSGLLNRPAAPPAATTPARRIAFVIDASGSMVDSMNQGALTWLERRLESLTDQDEFTVLFFRSNEVVEIPPLGMKSADSLARERALAWVAPDAGNIRPRGKSEPLAALQQAQSYRPTDLYILSDDKFGQGQAAADLMARDLEPVFRGDAPLVHTVQFFYPNQDDRPLEAIAQRFGGTYEFVKEPPFDLNPANDLGVDLLGISR